VRPVSSSPVGVVEFWDTRNPRLLGTICLFELLIQAGLTKCDEGSEDSGSENSLP
jgi:hypothetical protein